ncbi:MAG: CsgG/HfaB family protein [Bacillota bacterium]
MSQRYQQIIAIILLVFMAVTFLGVDFARAASYSDQESTKDSLEVLGVVLAAGLTFKLVDNFKEAAEYKEQLEQGKKYLKREQYALAISEFKAAQRKNNSAEVKELLGQAYLGEGEKHLKEENYNLAIESFVQAKQWNNSKDLEQLLAKAKQGYQQQHYQQGLNYKAKGELIAAYQEFKKVKLYGDYLDVDKLNREVYQQIKENNLQRIAVLDFEDTTYGYGNLSSKVAGLSTEELLAKDSNFIEVIDRQELNSTLDQERLINTSGLVESSTAKELGEILDVDKIIVGKILEADIETDISSEYEEEYDASEGEYVDKKIYTETKEAEIKIIFKLLDTTTGEAEITKTIKKIEEDSQTYESGENPFLISENELFDQALIAAAAEFADLIYDKYEVKIVDN